VGRKGFDEKGEKKAHPAQGEQSVDRIESIREGLEGNEKVSYRRNNQSFADIHLEGISLSSKRGTEGLSTGGEKK